MRLDDDVYQCLNAKHWKHGELSEHVNAAIRKHNRQAALDIARQILAVAQERVRSLENE